MEHEALKARNEYKRQWAKKNPDKIREYQRKYWERKAAANSAQPPKKTVDSH